MSEEPQPTIVEQAIKVRRQLLDGGFSESEAGEMAHDFFLAALRGEC